MTTEKIGVGKAIDVEGRTISGTATDETIDRMGDVVVQGRIPGEPDAGIELDDFKRNPVFLLAHDYATMPVGRVTRIGPVLTASPRRHDFEAKISPGELGDTLLGLAKDGAWNATSIGFQGLRVRRPSEDDAERFGPVRGVVFARSSLLELSAVSVPANPNALLARGITTAAAFVGELRRLRYLESAFRKCAPAFSRDIGRAVTYLETRAEDRDLFAAARERMESAGRRRRLGLVEKPKRAGLTSEQRDALWAASRETRRREHDEKIRRAREVHR